MSISSATQVDLSSAPFNAGRDETLHQSTHTRVFRRHLPDGVGSIVCKEPLGPNTLERLRHERKMLQRLAGIAGVPQLAEEHFPANTLALEDGHRVTLAEVIRVKRLDVHALLALALPLAHIIAAVHRAGVIHKDINPANILLDGVDSRPILIDYDLATSFSEERPSFIPTDEIAGTLAYLAPEQTGRTGRSVDQRADLYALGATLYELAVGHPPFTSDDPLQLIHDHLAHVPVPPVQLEAAIPPGLSDIILRLLEKEPDQRYQSAEGLAHDLMRLNDMQRKGGRGTFPLGERDFPLRLMPPSRLVGREAETGALKSAFDKALNGVGCVLVAGAPGVGKSALINELRPMVAARGGWFVSGKFDQYRHDAPSANRQALNALGRLLLAEPEAALAQQRARMLDALGPNAGLITAVSQEFAILLGPQPEFATSDPIEIQHRTQQVLVDLFGAIASPARPLVMVLDDLQWATLPSIQAIENLLTAGNLHGLLLVGAYREAEMDATHPFSALLQRWQRLSTPPLQLRLDNLPSDDLAMLLAEMLRLSQDEATSLAQAIGARTGGNPYDTIELVNALRRDGALLLGDAGWGWDAATIRRFVGRGEVVDLLAARIARLPAETQSLLEIMACLGGEVKLGLLQAASGLAETAEEQIAPSLEDGLLVMEHSDQMNAASVLRFRHDRVQQAAYGRLKPARRRTLHLDIARRLTVLPEFQAIAAQQYLPAIDLIHDADECQSVVALLREAALKARQRVSHNTVERLLAAALMLSNTMEASSDDPLPAALEIELHAALYSLGRLDEADAMYHSIAGHRPDPLILAGPTCVRVDSLTNRGKLQDALAVGLDLLRQLGLDTHRQATDADVVQQLASLRRWIQEDARADDQQRPETSDPRIEVTARLINRLMPPAFFFDMKTLLWLILESQRLWTAHGPCAALVAGLSSACAPAIALGQDYRCAYDIVRHVLAVGEAHCYEPETSQARFSFAIGTGHWFEPLEDDIPQARSAHEGLVRGGDLQFACWNYFTLLAALLDSAATLDSCAAETDAALAFATRTGNEYAAESFLIYRQLLRALRGETNARGSFTDSSFDEATHLAGLAANPLAGGYYHINHALASAMFGDTVSLAEHAAAAMPLLPYLCHHYGVALAHLFQSLALAERIKAAAPEERSTLLAEFDSCRDWLAARAADAPVNFLHLLRWIDAERAWAIGDEGRATRAFDIALSEADHHPRPWHRALMTERAALFHLGHGLERTGHYLLADARQLYASWGASAKVRQLEQTHPFLNTTPGADRTGDRPGSRHSSTVSGDAIDLLGVLRASQVLSSETSLEHLKARVIELLGDMTGATNVLLVLRRAESAGWFLSTGEGEASVSIEDAGAQGRLPLSAFRYAERTREALLVEDALRDERFARDPYLVGLEHCSLLAVPILSQGVLRAVLLLENRLSRNAFSADRLDAVMLIAGQLAVSLDNALLYSSLERKVAERTEDLKLANQRLETLSITDPLTGLANRRRFNEMIDAEWQRAIRPRTPIAVAMIDIDQFKLYNDHYGHLGGDECLRKVARALGECVRGGSDLVARYGGEEFVIVLPGAHLDAIHPVAERARLAVESLQEPHEKSNAGIVTISVGIAAMVPSEQTNAESLIELADAALFRAKKNGRNQVVGRKADKLPEPDQQEVRPIPDKPRRAHAGLIGAATAAPLRVLMIEDSAADAELILRELKRGLETVQFERVDTAAALNAALDRQPWDVAICDYHLPGFGALPALALVRQRRDYLPFIIVSGAIREETAVEAMKRGVDDYVLKSNLTRLVPAIQRELEANERRRNNALAEQALLHERQLLNQLMDNIPDAIFFKDREYRFRRVNQAFADFFEFNHPDAAIGLRGEEFMPAEFASRIEGQDQEVLQTGIPITNKENTYPRPDGRIEWYSTSKVPFRDERGEIAGIVGISRNITAHKKAELRIGRLNRVLAVLSGVNALIVRVRNRDELYREICRIAVEAGKFAAVHIAMLDPDATELRIEASSNRDAQYLDKSREALQTVLNAISLEARIIHDRLFVQRQAQVVNDVERELSGALQDAARFIDTHAVCALPLVMADQTVGVFVLRARETGFFDAEEVKLLVELAGDIAFALDHLDKAERLDYLAYYDQLTGLANATLFRERLAHSLHAANGQPVVLALLDVERFKSINDALGRPAGDALLKQLAERLAGCVGSQDQVAHLGADHFALILTDVKSADQVGRTIEHEFHSCFDAPFLIGGADFKAAAKIGIALHPGDGADPDTLFGNAEAALKKAKASGERYLFYAEHMTERVAERLSLENRLRRALEREEFVLHYQPKVALATGRMAGVEALIRWNDPATGLVPPMQFIPLLEETGLIREVGAWALRRAVADHNRWLDSGLDAPRIAVNVSAIQLRQGDFVDIVRETVAAGASPPGIDLEITESLIMEDIEGNIAKLNVLRDMGLSIAIDDFGTGYSSLAYLARLPVHTLKIDRSFVITMLHDPNTMTLVSTIIALAHSLGLKVVAEGVDEEAQAKALRLLRCDEMQGYLFGRPVAFGEISVLLKTAAG